MSIKISVVIPVYNAEKHIRKCLNHILNQTYKNLEIIIVDDGSKDNTFLICQEYSKTHSQIHLFQQKNSGPATARNNGLKHATGDYVHFHDSDDYVDLDYYEKMANILNVSNPDIACGEVNEPGYLFPTFSKPELATNLYEKILLTEAHNFNVVWRFLYNRKFLINNDIVFPSGKFIGEDAMFMYKALCLADSVITVPGAKYNCVNTPGSLGKNLTKIMAGRKNGTHQQDTEYQKFKKSYDLDTIITNIKKGILTGSERVAFLNIPIWEKQKFTNNKTRYKILGLPIFSKEKSQRRHRYYIFGLYLLKRYEQE